MGTIGLRSGPLKSGIQAPGPVADVPDVPVRTALVLAAGNGDRFQNGRRQSKLLEPILGQPLILRTLVNARDAGITRAEVVLGYEADSLRRMIERHAPDGLAVHFSYNAEWHLENGLSVLAARKHLGVSRFALLMGDHLFNPPMLTRLLCEPLEAGESALAIDSRPAPPEVAELPSARSSRRTMRSIPGCSSALRRFSARSSSRGRRAIRR
jgi:1L-myo-inositol 1-phosphate cytidylyltransferase